MLSVTSILLALQFQLVKQTKILSTAYFSFRRIILFIWDFIECSLQMSDDMKIFEFLAVFVLTLWVFGVLFLFCELGQRVTIQFDMFGDEFDRCDWQALPIGMQRMYLMFLADTQQSKYISCFFNIQCTRETFKKVSRASWIQHFNVAFINSEIHFQITNSGFSYFLTIRQFWMWGGNSFWWY